MTSALAVAGGVFAPLHMDHTSFAPFTTAKGIPLTKKKTRMHDYDSCYKIYTGLDHGEMSDAGGDLPDIQSK